MTDDQCQVTKDVPTVRMTLDVPVTEVHYLVTVHEMLWGRAGDFHSVDGVDCMRVVRKLVEYLWDVGIEMDWLKKSEVRFVDWLGTRRDYLGEDGEAGERS